MVVWCCHCSSGGHNERSLSKFHKRILRLASQDELDDMVVKTADEEVALNYVRDKCMGRKMPMVLVGAEYVSWVAVVVVVVGVAVAVCLPHVHRTAAMVVPFPFLLLVLPTLLVLTTCSFFYLFCLHKFILLHLCPTTAIRSS